MLRWGVRLMPWVPRALCIRINKRLHLNLLCQTSGDNPALSYLPSRPFSKLADKPFTELYFDEVFEFGLKDEDPLNDLRHYLYPSSTDPAILSLSSAGSVQAVFYIIDQLQEPNVQHLSQAVATLEHLQKLCDFINSANYRNEYKKNVANFNSQLRESVGFQRLYSQIENNIDQFELTDLAFIMMSMERFSEPLSSELMHKTYLRLNKNILKLDMTGLSYYSVAMSGGFTQGIKSRHSLMWKVDLAPALPHLEQSLKECDTVVDLQNIARLFRNLSELISDRLMKHLADKVKDFISEDKFEGPDGLNAVCKLLSVDKSNRLWHNENGDYVALLLGQVQGRAMDLTPMQALLVTKMSLKFGEPVQVYYEGYHRLCQVMENQEYLSGSAQMITCINCILQIDIHYMPLKKVEKILRKLIASPHFGDHTKDVLYILRKMGIFYSDIANFYFEKAFEKVLRDNPESLSELGHRYSDMYGGSYKNASFEEALTKTLLNQIQSLSNPHRFASEFGLLLAYGEEMSEPLMKRFHAMVHQMRPPSLYRIARGVEIKMKRFGHPRDEKSNMINQVADISVAINNAILQMLNNRANHLNLSELSDIFRSFTCRRSVIEESFIDYLDEKIAHQMDNNKVSSHFIHQLCSSLEAIKPPREMLRLTEKFLHFQLSRSENTATHVENLYKLIKLCYNSNHKPPQEFMSLVSTSLVRDLNFLLGRHVLDTCMFLVLFQALDKPTVEAVFSNEFMAKLDQEMDMNIIRDPQSLRNILMLVNRAVVIEYPEYGVHWFHQDYCKERIKGFWSEKSVKNTPERTELKEDVYIILCEMLGGWQYVKENSFSRYFNTIDYEVVLDASGQPVNLYQDTPLPAGVVRYAVQCYDQSKFTQDTRRLIGPEVLESRQLEAQGWRVVGVNPFSWNSFKMGEAEAKTEYLQKEMRATCSNL